MVSIDKMFVIDLPSSYNCDDQRILEYNWVPKVYSLNIWILDTILFLLLFCCPFIAILSWEHDILCENGVVKIAFNAMIFFTFGIVFSLRSVTFFFLTAKHLQIHIDSVNQIDNSASRWTTKDNCFLALRAKLSVRRFAFRGTQTMPELRKLPLRSSMSSR